MYKEQIEWRHGSINATESFVRLMKDVIEIMTSRFPAAALRASSRKADRLAEFLEYLNEWERSAENSGFISASTAEGLRVTLSSTLSLLQYATTKLGFRYIMTSRLSQDVLEQLFGILRQMSGTNDHPTPVQFLLSINTLEFMNLAKSSASGNVPSGLLSSLLSVSDLKEQVTKKQKHVDGLLDIGNLQAAHEVLSACEIDHSCMATEKSDSRLIFYVASYVARKFVAKEKCIECSTALFTPIGQPLPPESSMTVHVNMGGLTFPSDSLKKMVTFLENTFTHCFSANALRRESLADFSSYIQLKPPGMVGCEQHKFELTNKIINFIP